MNRINSFSNKTVGFTATPDKDLLVNQDINNTEFIYYEAFKINDTYLKPSSQIGETAQITRGKINKYGNFGNSIPARYEERRVAPILIKTSEYKFAVSNFSLPASTIPMFKIRNDLESPYIPNYYPNRYTIHFRLNVSNPYNVTTPPTVPYDFDAGYDVPPAYTLPDSESLSAYLFQNVLDEDNVYIYTYDKVIDEINNTFSRLFTKLKFEYNNKYSILLTPTQLSEFVTYENNPYLPQYPPFLKFDPKTDLFTFYADYRMDENYSQNSYGFLEVTLSNNLYELFLGNNFFFDTADPKSGDLSRYRRLIFKNGPNNANLEQINVSSLPVLPNPIPSPNLQYFIKNEQQFSSASAWYKYNKLILVSNSIGGRPSSIGVDKPLIPTNGVNTTSNIIATYNIILDNTTTNNVNSDLVYNPSYPIWIDMYKDDPLYMVDLQWFLSDNEGNLIPIELGSNEKFTVKLVFARKFF